MKKHDVYAWYFPNWHVDARNEAWHGKGWTEWDVVKHATPRFEGHVQPKVPLWGYQDEADSKVMEHKISEALSHGIDGFLWDFYWFEDGGYRMRALDEGFFGARNNKDFKFALMWCNHDPIYAHPASPRHRHDPLLSGDITLDGWLKMTDYMIEHYFSRENAIRVNGKLLFIVWNIKKLIANFGGVRGMRMVFDDLRRRVREAGIGEMYIAAIPRNCWEEYGSEHPETVLGELFSAVGIDGGLHYNFPPHCEESFPEFPYDAYAKRGIELQKTDCRRMPFPMELTMSGGWDCSPRTLQSDRYDNYGYPYENIVVERSIEKYERDLKDLKAFAESDAFTGHFITIATWNEWTEGNYVEPDEEFGYGFLDSIKKVLG